MAKIVRYNGNVVAPASAAIGTERTLFGSDSQANDLTSQFTPDMLRGWGIVGPSDQPTLQDFNAMGYTLGQMHAYLHQVGVAEWNAGQEYHLGSLANLGGLLFVSNANNNTGNNPGTDATNWSPVGSGSTTVAMSNANVTLTPLQAARSVIIITGVLTANLQLVFPAYAKGWQVINAGTGGFFVTCKTAAGSGVPVQTGSSAQIVGDGVNIVAPTPIYQTGIIGQSSNSSMMVSAASASATYTADGVVVGTALGGALRKLSNISEDINLATVGVGGMDVGLAPANGFVALYVIFNPTTRDVAMLATDATSVTAGEVYGGANMPAGYTYSALVSVVPTTAARLMGAHTLVGRSVGFDQVNVISTATQRASPFAFSVASTVPRNAKSVSGSMSVASSSAASASVISLSASAGGLGKKLVTIFGANGVGAPFSDMPCTYPGGSLSTVFYTATVTTGTMDADVNISEYKF